MIDFLVRMKWNSLRNTKIYFKQQSQLLFLTICLVITTGCGIEVAATPKVGDVKEVISSVATPSDTTIASMSSITEGDLALIQTSPISPPVGPPEGLSQIYITTGADGTRRAGSVAEVWELLLYENKIVKIYDVVYQNNMSINQAFPSEELNVLKNSSASLDNLFPESFLKYASLSSTEDKLVSEASDIYCAEERLCAGLRKLVAFELGTGQQKILLQTPLNVDASGYYRQGFEEPVWSPDGRYVATIRSVTPRDSSFEAIPIIVDVQTGQVKEMPGTVDTSVPLTWSPDSSRIGWILARWNDEQGSIVRICPLDNKICQDIELDKMWVYNWSMDWNPNGRDIVFAAAYKNPSSHIANQVGLHLLDVETGHIKSLPVNLDGILENPRWSPDGRFLAADYRAKSGKNIQSLLIIEPVSGQIVSQYDEERSTGLKWIWSPDSQSILLVKAGLRIFDVQNSTIRQIEWPDKPNRPISSLSWSVN